MSNKWHSVKKRQKRSAKFKQYDNTKTIVVETPSINEKSEVMPVEDEPEATLVEDKAEAPSTEEKPDATPVEDVSETAAVDEEPEATPIDDESE